MKTRLLFLLVGMTLSITAPAQSVSTMGSHLRPPGSTPKPASPESAKPVDLRPAMKGMTLKEGRNIVYSGAGIKLMAEVQGGRVVRWTATDDKGKSLPTSVMQKTGSCQICVSKNENGKANQVCYEVDCATIPAPAKKK